MEPQTSLRTKAELAVAAPRPALLGSELNNTGDLLIEFFQRLEKSKWWPWLKAVPVGLLVILLIAEDQLLQGLGLFAFIASCFLGMIVGRRFALILSACVPSISEDVGNRLKAAFEAFGFLFLPIPVGLLANAKMGADIPLPSVGVHFLWACVAAALSYIINQKIRMIVVKPD